MKKLLSQLGIISELFAFLWREKLWWMIPFVITLIILSVLIIFAQTSPVAPFLYAVF